jgi:NAD(P)-dependent dehydrogenase (short-subunit alcohol dehydrogenase family)
MLILSARSESKVAPVSNQINAKNPNVQTRFLNMDLSDLSAVRKAATQDLVDISKIDHVVCVAGVMICPYGKTKDGFEMQLGVNYLANFLLIKLLLPKVEAAGPSSSVIIVSSSSIRHGKVHFDDIGFSVSGLVPFNGKPASLTCHRRAKLMRLMLHTASQMSQEQCLPRNWLRS